MVRSKGFSLIELMVVISITAILIALAVPSFKRTIQSNNISSGVNSFLADMRFARSEAIRRSGAVVMCRSDAPEAANPSCSSTSASGWASGWIIFQDLNNLGGAASNAVDKKILRVQAAIPALDTITESSATVLSFTSTGRLRSLATSPLPLTFGGAQFDTPVQRVVCVSLGGYGRIAGDGASTCS